MRGRILGLWAWVVGSHQDAVCRRSNLRGRFIIVGSSSSIVVLFIEDTKYGDTAIVTSTNDCTVAKTELSGNDRLLFRSLTDRKPLRKRQLLQATTIWHGVIKV